MHTATANIAATDSLDAADRAAVESAVSEFVRKVIAPGVERPEVPLSPGALAEIDAAALGAGILPAPGAPGIGLWEAATPIELSVAMLSRVARSSAGIAFRFHLDALGARAARSLGLAGKPLLALCGFSPFGKGALASALHGEPAAQSLLRESFMVPGRAILVHGPTGWSELFAPAWENGLVWRCWSGDQVTSQEETNPHGLAEAKLFSLTAAGEGTLLPTAPPLAVFLDLLAAHALGCVAIALGAVEHALALAVEYAAIRRQGGALLREHAAIRLLLGEASGNAGAVRAMLGGTLMPQGTADRLESALQVRAVAHPLLCTAANHCLQVFGGYGYMQDYGLEKIVRDCNALRLVGGTTADLHLHLGTTASAVRL